MVRTPLEEQAEEIFSDDTPERTTVLQPVLDEKQMHVLAEPTPAKYIKSRIGRGGNFSYVEVGYVILKLNQIFGHFWDWEILTEQVGQSQVWVKGKLTVKSLSDTNMQIIKTAYGGSQIKKQGDVVIDIADDLKAASSDALKKAASMLGIAADVYFPQMDRLDEQT